MDHDETVITATRDAVRNAPDSGALRVHLAELLVNAGHDAEALTECSRVLATEPENLRALAVAVRAADTVGETRRAAAYRAMLGALNTDDDQPIGPNSSGPSSTSPDSTDPQTAATIRPAARERHVPVRLEVIRGGKDTSADDDDAERPTVRLADVGGMEAVKRRLNTAFLGPMRNPELVRAYGKSLRGGLLLYGPPGCGKTFLARAVAGELGAHFVSIGLHDVLDMWLGQSQKNLHAFFERARRLAPCVLFIDEVDALGRKRSEARHSGTRDVVVQFLAELDSFGPDNDGVFVLAATNHPWDVDSALRRPGRLDRTLLVLPPDAGARDSILRYHLRDRPLDDIDFASLAATTRHFSGADLAHACETATEYAIESALASGNTDPISQRDLERAIGEIAPSTLEWLNLARNYAQFANDGGIYDDLVEYLREQRML